MEPEKMRDWIEGMGDRELVLEFCAIPYSDHAAITKFLSDHPSILDQAHVGGLYIMAAEAMWPSPDTQPSPPITSTAENHLRQAVTLHHCVDAQTKDIDVLTPLIQQMLSPEPPSAERDRYIATVIRMRPRLERMARYCAAMMAEAAAGELVGSRKAEEDGEVVVQVRGREATDRIDVPGPGDVRGFAALETLPDGLREMVREGEQEQVNAVLGGMSCAAGREAIGLMIEAGCVDGKKVTMEFTGGERPIFRIVYRAEKRHTE